MTQLQQTAIHESAHIVIGHVLGSKVGYAFALDGHTLDGSRGEVDVEDSNPVNFAIMCLAGGMAQSFCMGLEYEFYGGSNFADWSKELKTEFLKENTEGIKKCHTPTGQTEAQIMKNIHGGRTHDLLIAWNQIRGFSKSDHEAIKLFDKCQHEAMNLVVENLPTIRALGAVLENAHVMTADEINGFLGMRKA